jgi:hypothetical protein
MTTDDGMYIVLVDEMDGNITSRRKELIRINISDTIGDILSAHIDEIVLFIFLMK